jgi:hypothetical protein
MMIGAAAFAVTPFILPEACWFTFRFVPTVCAGNIAVGIVTFFAGAMLANEA